MSRFRDEIGEQPLLASRMLVESRAAVASIAARLRESKPRGFVIAARGSSDHAALYAKYLFGVRNHTMVGDGKIKSFPLRGIKDSPPYMHDGRLMTLDDTIEFFNLVLGTKLSEDEKKDLLSFLYTL